MIFRCILVLCLLVTTAFLPAAAQIASGNERRIALVIGNNDYQFANKLDNAVADAQAFRQELQSRGFQVVYRENANRRVMNSAIEEFIGKLSTDSIGLIYYSGHGVQINGSSYLVPTDINAKVASDFTYDAVDLSQLIERVSQAQTKFLLAVIDACRDNPFSAAGRSLGGTRGLLPPTGNASGVMLVYSAGANQKALDRLGDADRNPNGLFTREFLKAIRLPGLTVQDAVNQIKLSVITQAKGVGHVQTPAIYDQSVGTFMFTPGAAQVATPIVSSEVRLLQAELAAARSEAARVELIRVKAEQERLRVAADMKKNNSQPVTPITPITSVTPISAPPVTLAVVTPVTASNLKAANLTLSAPDDVAKINIGPVSTVFPQKPIRLVVPFAAGGSTDVVARSLARGIAQITGEKVMVDNRPGAGGVVGSDVVSKSSPDGYTLLMMSDSFAAHSALAVNLPYEPIRDFIPITLIGTTDPVLVVNASLPVKSLKELIAFAKSHAGKVFYASSGVGSQSHFATEMLAAAIGVNFVHIPYKGIAPAVSDLLAGQVSFMFAPHSIVKNHLQAGTLRALAIAGSQRSVSLPEVPTFSENGIAGVELAGWNLIAVPANTPQDIVNKLNRLFVNALAQPEQKNSFSQWDIKSMSSTPEATAAFLNEELRKYKKIAQVRGIRID